MHFITPLHEQFKLKISLFLWYKQAKHLFHEVRRTHKLTFLTATQTAIRSSIDKKLHSLFRNVCTDFGTLSKKLLEGFLVAKRV